MTKKKSEAKKPINPLPKGYTPFVFSKKPSLNPLSGMNENHNQVSSNSPQFRINQHKGA